MVQSCRNSVPVPRHWSQKRKFLQVVKTLYILPTTNCYVFLIVMNGMQGKRGIEKPIFKLPDFIEATGITEMRQAYQV